jgi:hypothetical protein
MAEIFVPNGVTGAGIIASFLLCTITQAQLAYAYSRQVGRFSWPAL